VTTQKSTKDKILCVAERLFAERGFAGVTMRQIMKETGADVAAAYYHFKSKRDLFDAVLLHRADYLNEIRLTALEEVVRQQGEQAVSVEEIVAAFTRPLLELLATRQDEWRYHFALIAQINNSPTWGGELMSRYFDPLVMRFLDALRLAIPDCQEEDLYWSYHFLSGALTLTFAETGRLDNLSGGLCKSVDIEAANKRLHVFIAAGFRAVCDKK